MRSLGVVALALPLALGGACAHQDRTGAMGRGGEQAAAASEEPLVQPGPAVKGHAEDRVLAGRIASAQADSISIATESGDTRTLRIVPETSVQLDGQDSSSAQLQEGLPVQASFDQVSGENVAVEIWAGTPPSADQPPSAPGGDQLDEPRGVEGDPLPPFSTPK